MSRSDDLVFGLFLIVCGITVIGVVVVTLATGVCQS